MVWNAKEARLFESTSLPKLPTSEVAGVPRPCISCSERTKVKEQGSHMETADSKN
jgi:hypothetical protein